MAREQYLIVHNLWRPYQTPKYRVLTFRVRDPAIVDPTSRLIPRIKLVEFESLRFNREQWCRGNQGVGHAVCVSVVFLHRHLKRRKSTSAVAEFVEPGPNYLFLSGDFEKPSMTLRESDLGGREVPHPPAEKAELPWDADSLISLNNKNEQLLKEQTKEKRPSADPEYPREQKKTSCDFETAILETGNVRTHAGSSYQQACQNFLYCSLSMETFPSGCNAVYKSKTKPDYFLYKHNFYVHATSAIRTNIQVKIS